MRNTVGLDRIDVVRHILAALPDAAILANVGSASYYLFEAEDRPLNLYTFGALGQVSGMALGLSLAQPSRDVVTIDGDGSLLMNLSILAVIGAQEPRNLLHLVLDDGAYESTGGQPTATESTVSLSGVARACGITRAYDVADLDELDMRLHAWVRDRGATVIVVRSKTERGSVRPRFDPAFYRTRFKDALDELRSATA